MRRLVLFVVCKIEGRYCVEVRGGCLMVFSYNKGLDDVFVVFVEYCYVWNREVVWIFEVVGEVG